MTEELLKLPQRPGTVIAIGVWWLVRLRPYGDAPSAWELLPLPSGELTDQAERNGVKTQCVYGDEWVLAEAEQEGGYLVISDPRVTPSGVQYFRHEAAIATEPEPRPIWKRGDRVRMPLEDGRVWHGMVTEQRGEEETLVRWDHLGDEEDTDSVFTPALEREPAQAETGRRKLSPEQAERIAPGFDVHASRERDTVTLHLKQREEPPQVSPENIPKEGTRVRYPVEQWVYGEIASDILPKEYPGKVWVHRDGTPNHQMVGVELSQIELEETRDARTWPPGTRVISIIDAASILHGTLVKQLTPYEVQVLWDHDPEADIVHPATLEREESGA